MIRDLVISPDPMLHEKSLPIRKVTKELAALGQDLVDTMKHHVGLGLSAVQIGKLVRVICLETGKSPLLMYNPVVIARSPLKRAGVEGCLSFIAEEYNVKRHVWVKVKYLNKNNNVRFVQLEGLQSIAFQHEYDHLEGITFDKVGEKVKP